MTNELTTLSTRPTPSQLSTAAKLTRLTTSRACAEGVSLGSALLGSVLISEVLFKDQVNGIKRFLTRRVIEPRLEKFEKILEHAPSIETPTEKAERATLTRHERAERLTDEFMDVFVIPAPLGFVGQIGGQMLFDRAWKIPAADVKKHTGIVMIDRAAQLGTVVLENTVLARVSVKMQADLQKFLQHRFHLAPQRAEEWASYAVNIQIPNMVGMLAAIGAHYRVSGHESWAVGPKR